MWLISSHGEAVNVQLESCTVSLSDTNLTVSRYEHARRYRVLVLHVVWYALSVFAFGSVRDRFRCACGKDADLRLRAGSFMALRFLLNPSTECMPSLLSTERIVRGGRR